MFWTGDKVFVKHQRELGPCTVVDNETTDMHILIGEENGKKLSKPVGHYVVIDTPKAKKQRYHHWNLELTTVT